MRNRPRIWLSLVSLYICQANTPGILASTNSWTKPTSGYWEEAYWSMGILPAADQSVCFTNGGFKALALGRNTATNHAQTLTIKSLAVSAPPGSSNLLLLNYCGREKPLTVTEDLTIGTNAGLLTLASTLRVGNLTGGRCVIDGIAVQGEGADMAGRLVWIGLAMPGTYVMSNGWFYANLFFVGGTNYGGPAPVSTFVQYQGTNSISWLSLQPHSNFTLEGGALNATELTVGEGFSPNPGYPGFFKRPAFVQAGGELVVERDLILGRGRYGQGDYTLHDGSLRAEKIRVGGNRYALGNFQQNGGSVEAGQLLISEEAYHPLALPESYTYSVYTLSNGTLGTFGTVVGAGRAGSFRQYGGRHNVEGELRLRTGTDWSYYTLVGGTVSSWGLVNDSARFQQVGGTNAVSGSLTLSGSATYSLSAGTLQTFYTIIDSSLPYGDAFEQSGGVHDCQQGIQVLSPYNLSGGELRTSELYVTDTFRHRGGIVRANGIRLAGRWISEVTNHTFGVVNFAGGTLVLPNTLSRLTFTDGSDVQLWQGVALTIENWRGNLQGGGQHALFFPPGMSARATSLIWFKEPAGLPPGLYPSRLLPNGELVPTSAPTLAFTDYRTQGALSWGANWILQVSTNVEGPYEDVSSVSPYIVSGYNLSRQFFRLRR